MAVLCGVHHDLVHQGLLLTEGNDAATVKFWHADGTAYGVGLPEPARVDAHKTVFDALRRMGFRETEAKQAMEVARVEVGASAGLEVLLRSALRATTESAAWR